MITRVINGLLHFSQSQSLFCPFLYQKCEEFDQTRVDVKCRHTHITPTLSSSPVTSLVSRNVTRVGGVATRAVATHARTLAPTMPGVIECYMARLLHFGGTCDCITDSLDVEVIWTKCIRRVLLSMICKSSPPLNLGANGLTRLPINGSVIITEAPTYTVKENVNHRPTVNF